MQPGCERFTSVAKKHLMQKSIFAYILQAKCSASNPFLHVKCKRKFIDIFLRYTLPSKMSSGALRRLFVKGLRSEILKYRGGILRWCPGVLCAPKQCAKPKNGTLKSLSFSCKFADAKIYLMQKCICKHFVEHFVYKMYTKCSTKRLASHFYVNRPARPYAWQMCEILKKLMSSC